MGSNDTKTGELNRTLKDHSNYVYSIGFSANGQKLATCATDKTITVYNLKDFSVENEFKVDICVNKICFSHCSNHLYSGDDIGNLIE
eukprot:TRINITY_DN5949_c0_g1_i1.p1 TRINITY_DN5949_c0_g1~~TRINITY_DN5949_c0_g1_i1.p1  ORF type:complete len:87 (+),score=12.60 TRINITY_DN5949_c0_g1_i1:150-410(+)